MPAADLPSSEGLLSSVTSIQRNSDDSIPQNAELINALAILKKRGEICQYSLYDFLATLILRVIDEQPLNVIDFLELYCRQIRNELYSHPPYKPTVRNFGNRFMQSLVLPNAKDFQFKLQGEEVELEQEIEDRVELLVKEPLETDFIQLQHFWEIAGFPLTKLERAILYSEIQIHKHCEKSPRARFWGKIFSLGKTYYVLEVEVTNAEHETEVVARGSLSEDNVDTPSLEEGRDLYSGIDFSAFPEDVLKHMPQRKFIVRSFGPRKPEAVPAEDVGVGTNCFAYYVTTDLSKVIWEKLSPVKPEHISMCKRIPRFLSGNLSAEVHSYPKFPGTEKEYLGAVISRISAGSYIGPYDSVKNDDFDVSCITKRDLVEELSDEDAEAIEVAADNQDEEEIKRSARFLDSKSWTYRRPEVLRDGRTITSEPNLNIVVDDQDNESQSYEYETPEQEDTEKKTASIGHRFRIYAPLTYSNIPLAVARSNVWPGANALAFSKYSDFTYNGFGVKRRSCNYTPEPLPPIPRESQDGSLLTEMTDPSHVEQYTAIRPSIDVEEECETTTTTNTEYEDTSSEEEVAIIKPIP